MIFYNEKLNSLWINKHEKNHSCFTSVIVVSEQTITTEEKNPEIIINVMSCKEFD